MSVSFMFYLLEKPVYLKLPGERKPAFAVKLDKLHGIPEWLTLAGTCFAFLDRKRITIEHVVDESSSARDRPGFFEIAEAEFFSARVNR